MDVDQFGGIGRQQRLVAPSPIVVHVLLVARAVVHIDELILVVFRAASARSRTRGRPVLIAGFARLALLLLHALVLGAPILEPDFDLQGEGGENGR